MVKLKNKILKNSVALILLVFLLSFVKVDATASKQQQSGDGSMGSTAGNGHKPSDESDLLKSDDETFDNDNDNDKQHSKRKRRKKDKSRSTPSGPPSNYNKEHDQVPTKRAQQVFGQRYTVHTKVEEILNNEYQLEQKYVSGVTNEIVDEIARRVLIGSFAERAMFSGRVSLADTIIRLAKSYGIIRVFKFVWPIVYIPCDYIIEKAIPVPQQISNSRAEQLKVISNINGNNVLKNILSFVGTCVAMVYIDDLLGRLYAKYFLESYCYDCVNIIIADFANKKGMQKKQSSSDDEIDEMTKYEDEDEV